MLRRGGFLPAYLCEFNYKCFAGLKSVTPPRGHFCHLFMGCVGRVQKPDWLSGAFEQPVAITGQT